MSSSNSVRHTLNITDVHTFGFNPFTLMNLTILVFYLTWSGFSYHSLLVSLSLIYIHVFTVVFWIPLNITFKYFHCMWFDTCIKGGFAPFNSADYRHSNFDENGVLSGSDVADDADSYDADSYDADSHDADSYDADSHDEKNFSDDSVKTVISEKEKSHVINDSDIDKDEVIFNEKQAIEAAADVLSGIIE